MSYLTYIQPSFCCQGTFANCRFPELRLAHFSCAGLDRTGPFPPHASRLIKATWILSLSHLSGRGKYRLWSQQSSWPPCLNASRSWSGFSQPWRIRIKHASALDGCSEILNSDLGWLDSPEKFHRLLVSSLCVSMVVPQRCWRGSWKTEENEGSNLNVLRIAECWVNIRRPWEGDDGGVFKVIRLIMFPISRKPVIKLSSPNCY